MRNRIPPNYFAKIYEKTENRWIQLENDPELAAPWKQLFNQVQSPRHIVSELLQNADDVGASHITAGIFNDTFFFQHNGKDFSEDEFASLCKFGYSNKRKLHTIGFRGIGFKSTFSLGEPVSVLTPTLAVKFFKKRFTLPLWDENATPFDKTKISVPLLGENPRKELKKNLDEWKINPASLLFFNSIKKLTIENDTVFKQNLVKGPTLNSEKITLSGLDNYEIILFKSDFENFPNEAIDEIKQEKNSEETVIPPCQVELVLGLPKKQRLYVVLPTGVKVKLPFSCNAPFIQDPSRKEIKSPATSPTNRWLLKRIGKLGGEKMIEWLKNESLTIEERANAYKLLPLKQKDDDSLESNVTKIICDAFYKTIKKHPLILTSSGELVYPNQCYTPPFEIYDIWSSEQILEAFGEGKKYVISGAISNKSRQRLESWKLITTLKTEELLRLPAMKGDIPKPINFEKISLLWGLIQENISYDYFVNRRDLSIIPVKGNEYLRPAKKIVRMPAKKEFISEQAWNFLLEYVEIVDPAWLKYVESLEKETNTIQINYKHVVQLLRDIGLYSPSDTSTIMRIACINLFSKNITGEEYVLIAHLLSALDAKTPNEFRCFTKDHIEKELDDKIIATQDVIIEELTPDGWANSHLLHNNYFDNFEACTFNHWKEWIRLEKSGMWPFIPFKKNLKQIWSKSKLISFFQSRNVSIPNYFPYVTSNFFIEDFYFDEILIDYWENLSKSDSKFWAKIMQGIILSPRWYWEKHTEASAYQIATTQTQRKVNVESIPAEWITKFRSLSCLFDTYGNAKNPADLYMRNPETEPFFGIEPFVKAELDTESTRPLLQLLGVREKQADVIKIIDRLRSLSKVSYSDRILNEILKWYGVLEKITINADENTIEQIKNIFNDEALIFTSEKKWEKISEVFIFNSEEFPEAPTVHLSTTGYSLWLRLGISNHPTVEKILDWFSGLPINEIFDPETRNRVTVALKRFPIEIWNTQGKWLALNNTLQSIELFCYRLTMQSLTKYANLFPHVKSRCADFQMLKSDQTESQPFASLPDLSTKIEYRLTKEPENYLENTQKPKWLTVLGSYLKKIKINDETQKSIVYENAKRLESSFWITFYNSELLEVSPYIDGIPAGTAQARNVLWHENHIFIKEGSTAKSIRDIVEELAKPFGIDEIKEAFLTCFERNENFIIDYMEEYFKIEEEEKKIINKNNLPVAEVENAGNTNLEDEFDNDKIDQYEITLQTEPEISKDQNFEPNDDESQKSTAHRKKEPTLFDRYAFSRGFKWDSDKKRYINHDGQWIEKSYPPLHWQLKVPALKTQFWVQSQCLTQSGIEIPADLWNYIEYNPNSVSLILIDENGHPTELSGSIILSRKMSKKIELFPSKYIIRITENNK